MPRRFFLPLEDRRKAFSPLRERVVCQIDEGHLGYLPLRSLHTQNYILVMVLCAKVFCELDCRGAWRMDLASEV